jgi:hypothetical protein
MNHKELIERLRTSPAFDNTTLGNEAADAIEELQEILLNVENAHAVVAGAYGNILRERDTLRAELTEALQAAQPVRVPLTDDDISDIWDSWLINITDKIAAIQFAREIEREHHIGGDK